MPSRLSSFAQRTYLFRKFSLFCGISAHHVLALAKFSNLLQIYLTPTDEISSEATLTAPTFDFIRDSALLGPKNAMQDSGMLQASCHSLIEDLKPCDPRFRCKAMQLLGWSTVLQLVNALPPSAVKATKRLIRNNLARVYAFTTAAAEMRMAGSPTYVPSPALEADIMSVQARETAYSIWVLHIALSISGQGGYQLESVAAVLPPWAASYIINACAMICEYLSSAERIFGRTPWRVRPDIKFWICAFGVTVADTESLRHRYTGMLVGACHDLDLRSKEDLLRTLQGPSQLPLETLCGFDIDRLLYLAGLENG